MNKCNDCIHKDICKYETEMKKLEAEITEKIKPCLQSLSRLDVYNYLNAYSRLQSLRCLYKLKIKIFNKNRINWWLKCIEKEISIYSNKMKGR